MSMFIQSQTAVITKDVFKSRLRTTVATREDKAILDEVHTMTQELKERERETPTGFQK